MNFDPPLAPGFRYKTHIYKTRRGWLDPPTGGGRNAAQHNATQRSERRPPGWRASSPVCRESLGARTHLRTVQARVVHRSKLPTERFVERVNDRESWSITVRGPHRPEESPQCTVRRYGIGLPHTTLSNKWPILSQFFKNLTSNHSYKRSN